MDTHELAWAAGLFDGEGCIGLYISNKEYGYKKVQLSVGQNSSPEVLYRFQRAVSGVGYVQGPFTHKNPNCSPQYHYQVNSWVDTQFVIALLWKYLSGPKREKAHSVFKERKELLKRKRRPKGTIRKANAQ